jgi:membrane associated rhomboid family serine protease
MIPLNDTEPHHYSAFHFMTLFIIGANCLMFLGEVFGNWKSPEELFNLYGSVPNLILTMQGGGALSTISSIFLHGSFWHLANNMLALWVFGRRVEDACGPLRFLGFYMVCGVCSDLLSTLVMAGSKIPSVGASGAIFGLMGAYLLLFPGGKIRTLILLVVVPVFPKIRAIFIILYFIIFDMLPSINVLLTGKESGTNYVAHLGGFLGGVFVLLFLRPEAFSRYLSNVPV